MSNRDDLRVVFADTGDGWAKPITYSKRSQRTVEGLESISNDSVAWVDMPNVNQQLQNTLDAWFQELRELAGLVAWEDESLMDAAMLHVRKSVARLAAEVGLVGDDPTRLVNVPEGAL